MCSHLASAFIRRASFKQLHHFRRDASKGPRRDTKSAQGVEFRQLVLQILHPWGSGLGFQLIKEGLRGLRLDHQEVIQPCESLCWELGGHPRLEVLKKAVECGPDQALEFTLGRQL
jgi:hypothetical protein